MIENIVMSIAGAVMGSQLGITTAAPRSYQARHRLAMVAQSAFILGAIGAIAIAAGVYKFNVLYIYGEFAICLIAAGYHHYLFKEREKSSLCSINEDEIEDHECCCGGQCCSGECCCGDEYCCGDECGRGDECGCGGQYGCDCADEDDEGHEGYEGCYC